MADVQGHPRITRTNGGAPGSAYTPVGLDVAGKANGPHRKADINVDLAGPYVQIATADGTPGTYADLRTKAVACRATHSVAQAVASATWTTLAFNTGVSDPTGMHSNSVNPSRITVAIPGFYAVTACASFGSATGMVGLAILLNGSTWMAMSRLPNGNGASSPFITCTTGVAMNAGDYFEVQAYQDSGVSQNVTVGGQSASPVFSAWLVGR